MVNGRSVTGSNPVMLMALRANIVVMLVVVEGMATSLHQKQLLDYLALVVLSGVLSLSWKSQAHWMAQDLKERKADKANGGAFL